VDGGEEGGRGFGIACSNASPLFDKEKGVLHQMHELVQVLVIDALLLSVYL
jgi:hypothetical protein